MTKNAKLIVITGCSGGGKSTLLAELQRRGYRGVEEPGRRIVRAEQACGGTALPWVDAEAFLQKAIGISKSEYLQANDSGVTTFFDRSLIDAASALAETMHKSFMQEATKDFPYAREVFMAPPWPELFENDAERQHSFEEAKGEYLRLCRDYTRLGYEILELPKINVPDRADWLLSRLGLHDNETKVSSS